MLFLVKFVFVIMKYKRFLFFLICLLSIQLCFNTVYACCAKKFDQSSIDSKRKAKKSKPKKSCCCSKKAKGTESCEGKCGDNACNCVLVISISQYMIIDSNNDSFLNDYIEKVFISSSFYYLGTKPQLVYITPWVPPNIV